MASCSTSRRDQEFDFQGALKYALSCLNEQGLTLKEPQIEAVKLLSEGKDVFVWFPTGYGKSICYQLLPFVFDFKLNRVNAPLIKRSVVLIVSPLISLMVDQVRSLKSRGVAAAILSRNKGIDRSIVATEKDVCSGKYCLLYTAPEAIVGDHTWLKLLLDPPLCSSLVAITVDEAHCVYKWSSDFRPSYAHLGELRAFAPPGTPMLAATATVTESMRNEIMEVLEMTKCAVVSVSPNKPNIYYSVKPRSGSIGEDLGFLTNDLMSNNIKARRVIVYCQSLDTCASLYIHFMSVLGDNGYYPLGAEQVSDNRLYGMFHSKTDDYNKEVIMKSFADPEGIVRVVFATMALGMGVSFAGLTATIHYGAPRSLEDYFQESGRAGRKGEYSTSAILWKPSDAPLKKDQSISRNVEVAAVRRYLENTTDCRRHMLLNYFDPAIARRLQRQDPMSCCDNCRASQSSQFHYQQN